jgi:hypothetical protein
MGLSGFDEDDDPKGDAIPSAEEILDSIEKRIEAKLHGDPPDAHPPRARDHLAACNPANRTSRAVALAATRSSR